MSLDKWLCRPLLDIDLALLGPFWGPPGGVFGVIILVQDLPDHQIPQQLGICLEECWCASHHLFFYLPFIYDPLLEGLHSLKTLVIHPQS